MSLSRQYQYLYDRCDAIDKTLTSSELCIVYAAYPEKVERFFKELHRSEIVEKFIDDINQSNLPQRAYKVGTYRLSVVIPCWKRPRRTRRIIDCVLEQNTDGWEAFIIGDACPDFQDILNEAYREEDIAKAEKRGNKIHMFNMEEHTGGYGHDIVNYAIKNAKGRYFIWAANDDVILSNHFSNYLQIEKHPKLDYMYFNSWIEPLGSKRDAVLAYCYIGHSEIIVRTEFLKSLSPHVPEYGHDWKVIEQMIAKGKGEKCVSEETYRVMSVPSIGCVDDID